jgi:hypothetical protein
VLLLCFPSRKGLLVGTLPPIRALGKLAELQTLSTPLIANSQDGL